MRWIPFVILVFLAMVVQTTAVRLLSFHGLGLGGVAPDLLAVVAVFVALYARLGTDVMLAAWVLGFALDLTTRGGPAGGLVIGPLAVAYTLAAGGVFHIRGAFFREHILAQATLGLMFCAGVHAVHVTSQCLLAWSWTGYGRMLLQAVALSIYTAVLVPPGLLVLNRCAKWLLVTPTGRAGR